jgi:hypothetical protein
MRRVGLVLVIVALAVVAWHVRALPAEPPRRSRSVEPRHGAESAEGTFRAGQQAGMYRAFALRDAGAPLLPERVPVLAEFVVQEGQATTIGRR